MQITYRPPDLGYLVKLPHFDPWIPPPALTPWQDPYLLQRTIKGLRQLGGRTIMPDRPDVPSSRLYGRLGSKRSVRAEQAPERPRAERVISTRTNAQRIPC